MDKYHERRRLGSYTINHQLIRNLEDFINHKVPRILYFGRPARDLSGFSTLSLRTTKENKIHAPIASFSQPVFDDDIQVLQITLQYAESGGSTEDGKPAGKRAIVLLLRLGISSEDSDLCIAMQDEDATERTRVVEEGILEILEPHRNMNRVAYPDEVTPTFVFLGSFLAGIGSLMFENPLLKSLCIILFGIGIYFVARRFSQGYCSFETRRQTQLNALLKGFTWVVVLFVIGAIVASFWGSHT